MLFLELTVINKWWAVSLWQPSLTWVRSRYCSFPRPIHVLICCNFSRLIEIQWRESYRKFWFLSFYVFLDTCLNWYQLNTYLYTKEVLVAYVWFPYFLLFHPAKHKDPLSLSWSFEGIYLDVSMCSRSYPGTDQTLWWETLDLRRSQRRPTLWFFFWVAPKKWSMDLAMPQFRSKSKC